MNKFMIIFHRKKLKKFFGKKAKKPDKPAKGLSVIVLVQE